MQTLTSPAAVAAVLAATVSLVAPGASAEDRAIDGAGNNIANPDWGATGAHLVRRTSIAYADMISEPAGDGRPGPRTVSSICAKQTDNMMSDVGLSNMHTLWGQFLDHDITLTPDASGEFFPIRVPLADGWFDIDGTGTALIPLVRSMFDPATGTGAGNPRQQVNVITAFIDASMVYGSTQERADALRTLDGTGKLRTGPGNLLPFNTPDIGVSMANPFRLPQEEIFAAGDVRANENCQLTAMHTLFAREHNRICDEFAGSGLTGDEIYQRARKIVGGLVQWITYNEYLPALLGPGALPDYQGYDPEVNPGIGQLFQTAAFRFGHSQVNETMLRLDSDGNVHAMGHINARDALFAPARFLEVEPGVWLKGTALTLAQNVDVRTVSSLRNFLFGLPVGAGLDLVALNIQRGRDHGLPDYNQARADLGMPSMTSFDQMTLDADTQTRLAATYPRMDMIDAWVGGLSEDHVPGAAVGPFFHNILVDQFTRLRDGDRFWYAADDALTMSDVAAIEATTLADLIRRNTAIGGIPDDVFRAPGGHEPQLADLTQDGRVGFSDLIHLISNWGQLGTPEQDPRSDIDGNAVVGFQDLLYLLGHWTL